MLPNQSVPELTFPDYWDLYHVGPDDTCVDNWWLLLRLGASGFVEEAVLFHD